MTKRFFYLTFFITITINLSAAITYVSVGATGNGSSWTNAIGDLQEALQQAKKGDEIWVTKGVYFPTTDNNRNISFHIKNGVALYGSFAGFESSIEERIIKANYSVLSGEIGTKAQTDNTFNVLYSANATKTTIIDGFIITGGYAGGNETLATRFSSGGGMYNEGNTINPTIKNCQFIENVARDGGAIYNNAAAKGSGEITLISCSFQDNKAFLGGGAIFNNGTENGNCLVTITDNYFNNNTAGFGGAIFNYGRNGQSIATIRNSEFINNKAMIQGGGIFNLGTDGISESKLTNCNFLDNSAPKGSTVANSQTRPTSSKNQTKI